MAQKHRLRSFAIVGYTFHSLLRHNDFLSNVSHQLLFASYHVDAELALGRHSLISALAFVNGETLVAIVPVKCYERPLPLFVGIADAIVFIEREGSVGTRVDTYLHRFIDGLRYILTVRSKWQDAAASYEDRDAARIGGDGLGSLVVTIGAEVVPSSLIAG